MISKKRVLVLLYSQTGQLSDVVKQILAPLEADPHTEVCLHALRPLKPFPYPWPFFPFMDAFPESALMRPCPMEPLDVDESAPFDLVILPYQVWYLAPSLPVMSFLKSEQGARLLKGKPVVTVIACRNMWLMAQEKVKGLLQDVGAKLVDNVALTDLSPTLATLITTPRWLWFGKKTGFWGLPAAGLTDEQVSGSRRFGRALVEALHNDEEKTGAPMLSGLEAVQANPHLLVSERAGTHSFRIWGGWISALGAPGSPRRKPLLATYTAFLILLIVSVVPVSLTVQALLRPFMRERFAKLKTEFEQPSGSSGERLALFSDAAVRQPGGPTA
jgi:hypothetical protein